MSSTDYAKRDTYKPIDFFYQGVVDTATKQVVFVDAFQILNDRFLGSMNVCNYFFIAENSVRINELNIIALDELKNYHLVMRENFLIPEALTYSMPITTRFLEDEKEFENLVTALKENGYKTENLVLSFNSNTIMNVDDEAKKRYDELRRMGFKTCISGFGGDFTSLDLFAKFTFDYLRLEASYFDTTPAKKNILAMLVSFCGANNIALIMEGVDNPGQSNRFKKEGIKYISGKAVSKLARFVTSEMLNLPKLKGKEKEEYLKKLNQELAEISKKYQVQYDAHYIALKEKAREDAASGNVSPGSPRPDFANYPYYMRVEKQRQVAVKAADARAARAAAIAALTEKARSVRETYKEDRLIDEASRGIYDGDIQGMMSVSDDGMVKPSVKAQDDNAVADTTSSTTQKGGKQKKLKIESIDYQLGISSLGRFGGLTSFIDDDEEVIIGHYNEKYQWVDEDGYIYNGYFDEKGDWQDYELFNAEEEGHYNDASQWVDREGKVYDGYFDEQGRWVDYTFVNADGERADNGYFDTKIQKWIPYGYFDEKGQWKEYN